MTATEVAERHESSPRPWRCFFAGNYALDEIEVFSTSVEVFPAAD